MKQPPKGQGCGNFQAGESGPSEEGTDAPRPSPYMARSPLAVPELHPFIISG